MKKQNLKKDGYSTLIVLMLISFIIVLTTWIFRLVINEMKSNKVLWDYIKAYAWAESAQELALLDIKKKWYWYNTLVTPIKKDWKYEPKATILSTDPINSSNYNSVKDVLISYYSDWKTNNYEWSINKLWYDIIPLFYLADWTKWQKDLIENKITSINLRIDEWVSDDLSWNIIWTDAWISWIWGFSESTSWSMKYLSWNNSDINRQFIYWNKTIEEFLNSSNTNYLVLFNSWNSTIKYTMKWSNWYFTKPRLDITSSWEVWDFKQNIKTRVDNTEFLSILKYSIYSWDFR